MDRWYPLAHIVRLSDDGTYVAGPYRGVLHTTEGANYAGALSAYQSSGNHPHFTVSFESGMFAAYQHVSLDRVATALKHPPGTIDTNRLSCVQIEIVGFAAHAETLPTPYLDGLRLLMEWIEVQTGIHPVAPGFKSYPSSFGLANGIRFNEVEWRAFSGWCGHEHVPNNDHGGPGMIDINYLLTRSSKGVDVVIVDAMVSPAEGVWVLGADGGVFCYKGAHFYGSYPGLPPGQRQGKRTFTAIGPRDDGVAGYMCSADDGSKYRFP